MPKTLHKPQPQPMVSWLAPRVLLRSAQEVVLSGLFANFADKRETMAGLDDSYYDLAPDGPEDFWLDYVSDTGDGFDSTHTIARLVAAPELTVGGEVTKRGRALVLGGDQVYPSASWTAYEERFRLPYALALPASEPGPDLFAVPGNHDWYDGLTNFMRVFCQSGHIGGWQTRQRRSYFALRLPHDWWLFGIDIQFDAYIDGPQMDYFRKQPIGPGHKVILATAKPSWIHVEDPNDPPVSWNSLAYFDDEVICKREAQLALTITGDLHHYSNYSQAGGVGPKITAGGGGAYLSPTHWLPERRTLPSVSSSGAPPATYTRGAVYPDAATSRALAAGIKKHLSPARTPTLGSVLAGVYALVALLLAAGVKDQATNFDGALTAGLWGWIGDPFTLPVALLSTLLVAGLAAWAQSGDAPRPAGAAHAVTHLVLAWLATVALLKWDPWGLSDNGFWHGYATAAAIGVLGALAGRAILVAYLWWTHLRDPRYHANEVLAAQGIADYKNFLRLKIDAEGRLTVYAIGIDKVPHWTLTADGTTTPGGFRPDESVHEIESFTVPTT